MLSEGPSACNATGKAMTNDEARMTNGQLAKLAYEPKPSPVAPSPGPLQVFAPRPLVILPLPQCISLAARRLKVENQVLHVQPQLA